MQKDKLSSYIGIALQAGYVIEGSDKLSNYNKKLYLVLIDKTAGKNSRKIYDRIVASGIEGREVEGLGECNQKSYKLIGIKNKGLSEEIKKYLD